MGKFDDLLKSATNFVEQNKGTWKHYDWIAFMTEVKKKGTEINYDLQNNIGTMLESMKDYLGYVTGTGKEGHPLKDVSETVANFIKDTKGKWDHTAWEAFLSELSKKGIDLTERTTSYIGNVLESAKSVYFLSPKEETPIDTPKQESIEIPVESIESVEETPKEMKADEITPVEAIAPDPIKESNTKGKRKKARKPE
ncbi:MAG: hypothetical protein HQK91_13290 [Nitrospirae bacterium]|nr:hypothetical protein [Nitrospirota bacterium]